MKGIIYKFNPEAATTEEQAKSTKEYALMEKLERGEKPTMAELSMFNELWHPDCYKIGIVRVGGWLYDFRPYMKRYLVNEKYYGWREVHALNKTAIRRLSSTPSRILEIVEIPKREHTAA